MVLCWLEWKLLVTQSCTTLWDPMNYSAPGSSVHGILQARVGSRSPLQGIFLMQGSNPDLLHCRQILYCLSHQGRSEWVGDSGQYRMASDGMVWLCPLWSSQQASLRSFLWVVRRVLGEWTCPWSLETYVYENWHISLALYCVNWNKPQEYLRFKGKQNRLQLFMERTLKSYWEKL